MQKDNKQNNNRDRGGNKGETAGDIARAQFEKLPKVMQDAILETGLGEKLRKIAIKHQLHIDQVGMLENETMLVLLGLEPPSRFKQNIKRELKLSSIQADIVGKRIDENIFEPVRIVLTALHEEEIPPLVSRVQEKTPPSSNTQSPRAVSRPSLKQPKRQPPEQSHGTPRAPQTQGEISTPPPQKGSASTINSVNSVMNDKFGGSVAFPQEKVVIRDREDTEDTPRAVSKEKTRPFDPYLEPVD